MSNPFAPIDRYAVVGNPVAHSKSPLIHGMFAAQTGERIEYGRLLVPLGDFDRAVRQFAGDGASGCNITLPFKLDALRVAVRRSERAELAQAANWLRFDADGWTADNTDGAGLVRDIEVNARVPLAGKRVLIIGAGGAAGGALAPFIEARPSRVVVTNRTLSKAQAIVERHTDLAARKHVALSFAAIDSFSSKPQLSFDVIVNATSSSISGAQLPMPVSIFAPGSLAVDLMYGPPARLFLDWAEQHGARGRDGLGMLVEQANEAFFLWRGLRPDSAPVLASLEPAGVTPKAGTR